jgi:hypothetical protein
MFHSLYVEIEKGRHWDGLVGARLSESAAEVNAERSAGIADKWG